MDLSNRTLGPRQHNKAFDRADAIKFWATDVARLLDVVENASLSPADCEAARGRVKAIITSATRLQDILEHPSKEVIG